MSTVESGAEPCLDERVALALAAGRLGGEAADRARAHVRSCGRCAALLEQVSGPTLPAMSPPRPADPSRTASLVPSGVTSTEPALERVATSFDAGSLVAHFVVLRRLGAGAMGEVYAAYDPKLDRKVALKVLKAAVGEPAYAEQHRARMRREAQALARLSHPSLVGVYEVLTHGDELVIVMEHVGGGTLRDWLRARRSWREIVRAFLVAGEGLAAAHEAGIVHRDFKPDNVLVTEGGGFKVADFGVSKLAASGGREEVPYATPLPDAGAALLETAAGSLVGTPAYMSPEALSGQACTEATDLYAYASALYEALYGELPFAGAGLLGLREQKRAGRPRAPSNGRRVPGWLRSLVVRGLDPDPRRRYPSMRALLAELARDRTRERRRWAALTIGVPLVLFVAGAAFRRPPDLCLEAGRIADTVWGARPRDRVRAAFLAAGGPAASSAADEVDRALAAWVDRWRVAQLAACRETPFAFRERPGPATSPQRLCLEVVLGEALVGVEVLESADETVVAQAPHLVRALPEPGVCAGLSPPLSEALTSARRRQVRARLALGALAATALGDGVGAKALAEVDGAYDEAAREGWPGVAVEALLVRATIEEARGERAHARRSARRALTTALRGREPEATAYAWAALAALPSGDAGDQDDAFTLEVALAVNGELGQRPRAAPAIARARLRRALAAGRGAEAVALAKEALEAARHLFGEASPDVARAQGELGAALLATGASADAAASLRQAFALRGRGASHFEAGRWGALLARALALGAGPGPLGAEASEVVALARAELEAAGPPGREELRALEAWLGATARRP